MTLRTTLRLTATMALWSSCFPLISLGLEMAPHLMFASMRAALAGGCLLGLGALLGRRAPRGARAWALVALAGLGAITLGFLGMFHGAEFVSPGLATVITNTQPLLAAILASVFLAERLHAAGKAGLIIGFAGILTIAGRGLGSGDSRAYLLGIGYVLLAATGVAIGNIAMKRLAGAVDPIMAIGFQLTLGAGPLALLSWLAEDTSSMTWSGEFLVVLVALAIPGTALPFWLWFGALKEVDLSRANAFSFLLPLFGLAIGAAFFGERMGWIQAAGIAMVLAGIVFVERDARRGRPEPNTS